MLSSYSTIYTAEMKIRVKSCYGFIPQYWAAA